MTRAGRIIVLTLLFVVFATGVAHAKEYYESYADGLKSVESKNWSDVIAKMTEAIGKNPQENKKARTYGANFIQYHPYYYRGIAYFNQGKYQEAIDDLQRALGVGKVNLGTPESWVLRAEQRMSIQAQLPPTTTQAPPPTTTQAPPPTTTQAPPPTKFPPPTTTQAPPPTKYPPPTTTQAPPPTKYPPPTTTQAPPPVLAGDTSALKSKVRDALRSYFNGDFQRSEIALDLLSKEQSGNAMIWAFLGASRYNGYVLSGEANASMKSGAEDAFRRARQIKPALRLDAKYFSPRVRNFYESIN